MASALDALPHIKDIESMCMALKCTESELFELKKAIKFEMAQEVYNGQALLKVSKFREFDPHRKHRDEVQRRVAECDPVAQEIFEGSRWPAADRAAYQKGPLVKVMDCIIRSHSLQYKQGEEKKAGRRLMRNSDQSTTESEESSPAPEKRRTSERRSASRVDIINLGSSPAQAAVPRGRAGTPAQTLDTAGEEEAIEDTPQRNSKRQRLSLADAVVAASVPHEKGERGRSHGPTPSPLTYSRAASSSGRARSSPFHDVEAPISPSTTTRLEIEQASLPLDVQPQTETHTRIPSASPAEMIIKEEEPVQPNSANFPADSLAAQMQNTIFQLVDARVDSRKLELADELNSMIDQSVKERVAEALATREKEMEKRITAHVMAELIRGFSGSAA